jgi:hypothetical protein
MVRQTPAGSVFCRLPIGRFLDSVTGAPRPSGDSPIVYSPSLPFVIFGREAASLALVRQSR